MKRKCAGNCACCEAHVWDEQDDLASWPGKRATMMLADGSHMPVTLCNSCLENSDLDAIWQIVINGWIAEGATEYAAKQMNSNFILCILYTTPWVNEIPLRIDMEN